MFRFTNIVKSLAACAVLASGVGMAAAADDYPSRAIRLVVGFGPGTGSDVIGRVVAQQLSVELGQTVVVENKPGATGGIATKEVIAADPDGYTLIWGTNATLINTPILNSNMNYQADVDLAPVAMVARTPMVLVTAATDGAPKSVAELAERLKAGSAKYGSAGVGTIGHVFSEIMLEKLSAKATLVTYKSSSESLTDVVREEMLFAVDTPAAVLPFVTSGKLRPLAVSGSQRLDNMADVPTFEEAGVGGLSSTYAWFAILAPAKTPEAVTQLLSKKIAASMESDAVKERLAAMNLSAWVMSASEFGTFLPDEIKSWGGFVRGLNLAAQ